MGVHSEKGDGLCLFVVSECPVNVTCVLLELGFAILGERSRVLFFFLKVCMLVGIRKFGGEYVVRVEVIAVSVLLFQCM